MINRLPHTWARLVPALTAVLSLIGCEAPPPAGSIGEMRETLTFGLLPDENPERLMNRYATILEAVKGRTGLDVELILPETYGDLVDLFGSGTVDVAYFGGYTFVLANQRHGAVPLVMRDIDTRFVSHVVVHRDNGAVRELSDLRGAHFSFGPQDSTSGHLMPRYFFSELGISPEKFFSEIRFSAAHDETVQRVADGTVDAGVANGQIVEKLLANVGKNPLPVRIIWQSPRYVNYVWAVQPTMSEKTRGAIKEAFLLLSTDDENDRRFLDAVGAAYYLPTHNSDFDNLRRAIESVKNKEKAIQEK